MTGGRILAFIILVATVVLVAVGTIWPNQSGSTTTDVKATLMGSSTSPEGAVDTLLRRIANHDWENAYASLANKGEFGETDFIRDLMGSYGSLRTYATLTAFDVKQVHIADDQAQMRANLRWASVVGTFQDSRNLKVTRTGDRWQVEWPIVKEARVPPQVIPVNYLRWDVIYRGAGDDWGAQDVESPHVRIVAMNPVERGGHVVIMGELLNDDVVPAFVNVKSTLLAANGSSLATEDSFDRISHTLLPKQVTPFRIDFKRVRLSQVDSIRMQPSSILISASADPVIGIESQHLNPAPDSSLTGQLVNQSGQVVNVAHVIGTFYDSNGQIIWISDQYPDRALLPQTPVPFHIAVPPDLSGKINNFRVIASTYSASRFQ